MKVIRLLIIIFYKGGYVDNICKVVKERKCEFKI